VNYRNNGKLLLWNRSSDHPFAGTPSQWSGQPFPGTALLSIRQRYSTNTYEEEVRVNYRNNGKLLLWNRSSDHPFAGIPSHWSG
jgi:hypothetical protein